jgi:hypothetical protein
MWTISGLSFSMDKRLTHQSLETYSDTSIPVEKKSYRPNSVVLNRSDNELPELH